MRPSAGTPWGAGLFGTLLVAVLLLTGWAARPGHGRVAAGEDSSGGSAPPPALVGLAPAAAAVRAARDTTVPARMVSTAWLSATALRGGLPERALMAYAGADLVLAREQPGCHLGWNTLAGIGAVESVHGTIGGRTLLADGHASAPVLGPVLDGGAFAAIRPTEESARAHGNTSWDRAIGPMQFIGSTWQRWAADGDRDGRSDPFDLDDAALAAGRYLCADGHDLATDAGWNLAVLSYNHDPAYALAVNQAARLVSGLPRG